MATDDFSPEVVSRQLIELSLTRPPVHSFNRQLVRVVIDTVGAMAATLWLVRENELILSEEIEDTVGAVRGIGVPEQKQQEALRGAFEEGKVVVLRDGPGSFDALASEPSLQNSLVFIPVTGLRGNLGVLRLLFGPIPQAVLKRCIQLAETLSGYYSLYSAQRILTLQHEERQDIDRLSKAILQLQHYTFSPQLPEVLVNSAVEVARLDRAVLLTARKNGELRLSAASSVSQVNKKGAWARLVCELGEVILQTGEPLHFFTGISKPEEIEDEELRQQVNSYVLMTDAKSLLLFPLNSDGKDSGVLVCETFGEQPLGGFERTLCTVYAAHAASALANHRLFQRIPFGKLLAPKVGADDGGVRRGVSKVGKALKWMVVMLVLAAVVWFVGFYPVPEKVGADCFVEPETTRFVTAGIEGKIERVNFKQGDYVSKGDLLIKLETDEIELSLGQKEKNAKNIEAQIKRFMGDAENETNSDRRSELLALAKEKQFELEATRQEIGQWRYKLKQCYLKAPMAGTILEPEEPAKMLGVTVRPGEDLCRIGSISERVKVKIAVPAARVSEVAVGDEVEIRLRPLITRNVIRGRIREVAERSKTYKNSNVFIADVIVDNPAYKAPDTGETSYLLKPGMTGKAKTIRPGKSTYVKIYGNLLYRKLRYWLY